MMYRKLSIFTEVDLRMKYQVCAMENTLKQKHGKKKKKSIVSLRRVIVEY